MESHTTLGIPKSKTGNPNLPALDLKTDSLKPRVQSRNNLNKKTDKETLNDQVRVFNISYLLMRVVIELIQIW